MSASFFGLDDFDDLVSRRSMDLVTRHAVDTVGPSPPPPLWMQSRLLNKSDPLLLKSTKNIGNTENDQEAETDCAPLLR
jgi:hypothetical protein